MPKQQEINIPVSFDKVFQLGKHEGMLEEFRRVLDEHRSEAKEESEDQQQQIRLIEDRVTVLESWQWKAIGMMSVCVPVASYLVHLILN